MGWIFSFVSDALSNFAKIEEIEVKKVAKADWHISCVKKAGIQFIKSFFPLICGTLHVFIAISGS